MDQFPTLDPGVTHLDDADAPSALYRLVGHHLAAERGPAYWVDARNRAAPAALYDHLPRRACRSLRVARAFTGYQHYELVRSLPGVVRQNASLVVAPAVAAPYAADDVPEYEARELCAAVRELLGALATAVDVPVLVTASAEPYAADVRAAADRTLDATATDAGLRVEGAGFRPDVYWDGPGFQTTIPYWVDLLGAVDGADEPAANAPPDPAAVPGV
ncbi:MAG: hypothetical protein ABEJ40_09565 [Haloarculaceae archaeon]